ncbi:hypothetical protein POTOM_016517 [Populus tomentosa]|uniref:Phosphatidate cytidylyltransferase n=1 Tax=Populus tomentosa TaxID=118781 RepID=A0A8X8A3W3_POPTO|nr:hypothetical protein POTOM_016517 [Populus tomentosa]
MHKDNNNTGAPSTPTARLRHRKRSSEAVGDASKENGGRLLVNDQNKYKSMWIRAQSTIWMIGSFAFVVYMGHLYITAMVVVIQIYMAKELFNLLRKANEERQLPGFRLLNWHFFFTAMLFVYGRILNQRLYNTVTSGKSLYQLVISLIKYHMVICYSLYIAGLSYMLPAVCSWHSSGIDIITCKINTGFMWFILTLKKKMYKYQFGQYAWTHMILIVVFTQSSFTVANIFEGIFWFLLPATLIVINDIFAYICGFFFGKTPLIKLSPKKTWEGFIGASITTMISAFVMDVAVLTASSCAFILSELLRVATIVVTYDSFSYAYSVYFKSGAFPIFIQLANIMGRFQWLTCPRKDLSTGWLQCDPGPLFKPEYFTLPGWIPQWVRMHLASYFFPWKEISILPVQWHALCLGLFASIIAPFGGFFASGFKRAFKVKDFGDSIPGHGGITDRMDCQMVMAVFAYIYHQSFVVPQSVSVDMLMEQILRSLPYEEQYTLYTRLAELIRGRPT